MIVDSDPADAFCLLWDSYSGMWPAADCEAWSGHADFEDQVAERVAAIIANGEIPAEFLDVPSEYGGFVLAVAIDEVLGAYCPASAAFGSTDALPHIVTQYGGTGTFNTHASGALLPRWVAPGRPAASDATAEWFPNLCRVETNDWAQINLRRLLPEFDLDSETNTSRALRIACLPFVSSYAELKFQVTDGGYWVGPEATEPAAAAVAAALEVLDRCDVDLAILPEGTADDRLVELWKNAIRANPPDAGARLRWILVGTGPDTTGDKPPNRARILHRETGEPVSTQDKRHRFFMTAELAADWCLDEIDEGTNENITLGTRLEVLESLSGRYVVLICEDLGRSASDPLVVAVQPSHMLVPILDKEILAYRWQESAANRVLNEIGGYAVVSNSLAVLRVREARGLVDTTRDGPHSSALAHLPEDVRPESYPDDAHHQLSTDPLDPAIFEFRTDVP